MKTGRNDPCPCGSGRKYKQCCLIAETTAAQAAQEMAWRRIRRELEGFAPRMMHFTRATYGDDVVDRAWDAFCLYDPEADGFDSLTPLMSVFGPWLFHHWAPDAGDITGTDASLVGVPPTAALLARQGRRLAPALREYLQSCLASPFSYYEVEDCVPGQGVTLRDLFTGEVHAVMERSASQGLEAGVMIYAKLAQAQGVVLAEAIGPVVLSPADRVKVIELRRSMRAHDETIDPARLRTGALRLRSLFLQLTEQALSPALPGLQTTDGEDLEFHRLVYAIDSPQRTFEALADLDSQSTQAELRERAQPRDGDVQRAEIVWTRPDNRVHSHWPCTVLGDVCIDGTRLTVEVSSRERAEVFKALAAERLPGQARLRADELQSRSEMLARARAPAPHAFTQPGESGVEESPEVQALLAEYLQQHYTTWIDEPLPALGGRTPREAIGDTDGRDQVEALIQQFERHSAQQSPPADIGIFRRLREQLGLVVES